MSYPIDRSPLYGISSIHVLARTLQIRVGRLRDLAYLTGQFKEGTTERNGKERKTETPIRSMRRIHNRVQALLTRIETPDYLHSGKKKRSYLSNAKAHEGHAQSFQVDISKFYPSCTWHHVYLCFRSRFRCSSYIAGILASILTYSGHIPTGSPNSSLLAFFVHRDVFDTLNSMAMRHGLTMTVLQDDITFSGLGLDEDFRAKVRKVIKRKGLNPKRSKQKYTHGGKSPEITGIVLTGEGPKAPWSRHHALHNAISEFESSDTEDTIRKSYQRAMGRLSEIEQVQGKHPKLKARLRTRFRERLS
ncbi:MAG: reverse transcriptase family protein [Parvularcula sp.]|jgi:hypothetical protein|nr:reverse transcriptase family protein [Parvularcula sp.]